MGNSIELMENKSSGDNSDRNFINSEFRDILKKNSNASKYTNVMTYSMD
jgi:hypothetical protein